MRTIPLFELVFYSKIMNGEKINKNKGKTHSTHPADMLGVFRMGFFVCLQTVETIRDWSGFGVTKRRRGVGLCRFGLTE